MHMACAGWRKCGCTVSHSGLTALHVACRGQAVLVATLLLVANFDGGGLQDCRECTVLHTLQLQMHLCANHQ